MDRHDVLIVGAGPTGLACAIEARKRGLTAILIEKGCVVNSIYHYPLQMIFFTTPERLEIGDLPMISQGERPGRLEALKYYRRAADHYGLDIRQYEAVERVCGNDGDFTVHTNKGRYRARKVIIATGYYGSPNRLDIPGEELPKVMHYYSEGHAYYGQDVAVIGGKNSAAISALELARAGARVTVIHRRERFAVKSWIQPDIQNRITEGAIRAYFNSVVTRVDPHSIQVETPAGEVTLANDFVFAMIGYHPDLSFLSRNGIPLAGCNTRPAIDPETLETGRPGVHLAGVIVAGHRTDEIFIENGRLHGKQIVESLRL